ncbi:MAG: hypothetical protein C5B50_13525 [Verrucomicrobia bacterium]|nr:MAG: hypothetical protein C5B50_13525 [Verrucomicrobiota bacterium]
MLRLNSANPLHEPNADHRLPMNTHTEPRRAALAYIVAILGCFFIVAALVWAMRHYTQPPALGEDRAAVRAKALAELRAAEHEALTTTGWVDPAKGIVRLRIEDAMDMVLRDWSKNPSAARSNLVARVEKATFVPPKAPSPLE